MNIPHDQREVSDEDLFNALDMSWPGLERVSKAWKSGRVQQARTGLVRYFQQRKKPCWVFDNRQGNRKKLHLFFCRREGSVQRARDILKNRFICVTPLDFGKDCDWLKNKDLWQHSSTTLMFRRTNFFADLNYAWAQTGQTKFAAKFAFLMDKWLKDWPLVVDKDVGPGSFFFSRYPSSEAMSTAFRTLTWIETLYGGIAFAPQVSDELVFRMLKAIYFQALQYRRFAGCQYERGNHHLWERGVAPYMFGVILPEFPELRKLKKQADRVVRAHVRKGLLPDGCCEEHSISYSEVTIRIFLQPQIVALVNNTQLLNAQDRSRLARCAESLMHATAPDSFIVPIGDGYGQESAASFLAPSAALLGCPSIKGALEALELKPDMGTDEEKSRYRKLKSKQPGLSATYNRCGYVFSRDAWSSKANYCALSANKSSYPGHAHYDPLSVCLYVHGECIIGEPAARVYSLVNSPKFYGPGFKGTATRGYIYNMTSHNTVLVGGKPIQTDESLRSTWGGKSAEISFLKTQSRPNRYTITASHTGYSPAIVKRRLDFMHRTGWSLTDEVIGWKRRAKHICRWHFAADVDVEKIGPGKYLARKGDAKLLCSWPAESEIKLYRDRMLAPIKFFKELPWVLDVSFSGKLTSLFIIPGQ
ncbi:heparinase II/III family protein [Verrucomicrobiota bacterium]